MSTLENNFTITRQLNTFRSTSSFIEYWQCTCSVIFVFACLALSLSNAHASPIKLRVLLPSGRVRLSLDELQTSSSPTRISVREIGSAPKLRIRKKTHQSVLTLPGKHFVVGARYSFRVNKNGHTLRSTFRYKTRVKSGEKTGELKTLNSSEYSGSYYLPKNYALKPRPLIVALHGQDIFGNDMIHLLREDAKKSKAIIVAPDSRIFPDGIKSWELSEVAGEGNVDYQHVQACITELLLLPGITINEEKILVLGVSAGGSSAGYLATNDSRFTELAILHGGIRSFGHGLNRPRAWLSTGTTDLLRTPEEVSGYIPLLEELGFVENTYQEFVAGHNVPREELEALFEWWGWE